MKTVADFKRRMKVGVEIHTTHHMKSNGRDKNGIIIYKDEDMGVCKVGHVGSTQFAINRPLSDGKERLSWCPFPKASMCKFDGEDSITLLEYDYRVREGEMPLIPLLTYKFV
jgi:hypothetical protein